MKNIFFIVRSQNKKAAERRPFCFGRGRRHEKSRCALRNVGQVAIRQLSAKRGAFGWRVGGEAAVLLLALPIA